MKSTLKTAVSWAVLAACAATAAPVFAQETKTTELETVVVTARKRSETDISVPVSITAMSAAQIERNAIFNVYDLAQKTPTLTISNTGSGVGGTVFLRGIGSAVTTGNSIDQSVSFDIDGVPVSRGNILRIGDFDLEQLQMLKGPQALFFGKNSTAGVLAFTSKDPTDANEAMVKLGYEPFANTRFGEFAVSGPLTDTLKARVFARYAKSDGFNKNLGGEALPANAIVPNTVFAPSHNTAWRYTDKFVRGTVLWEPSSKFTARFKASYDEQDGDGVAGLKERFYCPLGHSQNTSAAALPVANGGFGAGANAAALAAALSVDDCKLNGTVYEGDINPAFLTNPTTRSLPESDTNGVTKSRISLASAEFNYAVADHIDLTAVSGFVRISENNYDNFSYGIPSPGALMFNTGFSHRQFTQELRLRTSFEGPVNVMVGGFYQHAFLRTFTNNFAVAPFNVPEYRIPNDVWSGFGQLTWNITDQIELAGGARYTEEKKSLTFWRDFVPQPVANPNVKFTNTSPEATLTWRPSSDMTVYAAYKTGFKSGGYATTQSGNFAPLSPVVLRDFTYRPEKAEGFEGGWKAQLFDRTLRLDATIYTFEYKNLQVSNVNTSTGVPVLQIFNAATVRQKGIEVEGAYYPPAIEGLRLSGLVNYNRSKYTDFLSPCYIGQSIAEGCNLDLFNGAFQHQQLAGRRVTNAPLWAGNLGFTYTKPVDDMRVEVGADVVYKSSYNVTQEISPGGHMDPSTVLNMQFRVINAEKGWEFGIYAKNLTDVRRALETSNAPLTGISANTGRATGGVGSRADLMGNTTPGRSVLFQLVLHPSQWVQ
jgi:iron complex outermembrane receptor protein